MRTPLTTSGSRLAKRLVALFLLFCAMTMASQAMAARPVIVSPATGTTLPPVAVNQSMSVTITATGGANPLDGWYECDIDDPSYDGTQICLPPGLTLNPSPNSHTTTLSGSPTTAGSYTFAISLNDGLNQAGVATYTLVVSAGSPPTLTSVAPNSGSTAGATSVVLTGTNLNGATAVTFGGVAATSYSITNATSITATTPAHAAGPVNVVVTTPNGSVPLTNGYTYTVPAPTAGPVSATVAANSSANPITLSLSGGAASSVAVSTAASHGTATASGTNITYTPTAGYSGSDTFAYTATNASGTSSPATVTITVSAPTINLSPTTLPSGTQGTAYSQNLSTSGGTAPYSYAVTAGALPTGLSLSASGVISGTPSANGTFNLTITATDANSATGSRAYSLLINGLPPVASAVSATVAANSSANPITLNLSGGAATSVAVSTAAAHGTATASGTTISYTPTAGYSGSDTFAYTATNANGTSGPATVTITVSAPTINLSPTTLPSGTQGTAYSQNLSTSGGTAPYSYAVTSGALPTGMSLNTSTGLISGTPSASGTFNLTITATDANSATGSRAYSLLINGLPPVAGAVSTTVAANSSANPITLNLSGGAATSVAVSTAAAHGTATASGTTISYTPTAGYSGSDTFAYTATNANGTSGPATVTITVSAPTINLSPTTLPSGTQGTAYSQNLSTSGGTAPYSYAVTAGALPTGLSLSASGVISGTPSANGTFNLTITATDANSATGSRAYSLLINGLPPVASAVSTTVAANSSTNPITLILSGGAASSVAVASAASHGSATASGTSITYTPTVGFAGTDSFTYTATNASGTSSAATVSITVTAPSISVTPGSLSGGTLGNAYSATIGASGGTAPYSYAVSAGALPTGLTLSPTGSLSGTPTAIGSFAFTLRATDANNFTGTQAYNLTISGVPPIASAVSTTVAANSGANPITLNLSGGAATSVAVASAASHGSATASGTSISYTPTAGFSGSDSFTYTATNISGTSSPATVSITVSAPSLAVTPATLGAGTAGSAYSATLSVSGGTAPYSYSISSGSLPAGLSLNTTSGLISGTPTTSGTSNLTITATDTNGATGTKAYSITIAAVAITVPASSQILAAGQSATVDLTQGATGGPFTQATLASVTPASAGRAMMISRFSMRFIPSAAFAGTAIVSFSLQNGSGSSAASTVSFMIQERPDPTKDAEVIGLLNAQTRAAERFASTQMDNFNRRMEQLHQMKCDRTSFNASLRKQGQDVPLGEIAKAVQNQLGDSAHKTEQEQREAAAAEQDECKQQALAFWSDGFVNVGSTHARGARDNSFTTMGLSAGADYRLSPSVIAGIGIGYGNDRSDIGSNKTRSDADAIGIATYLSLNLAPQVFIDGLLGYNRISFDSRRYITGSTNDYARGSRDADQLFASLTASYEYRQGPLSLTPYSRLNASSTRLDAFRESGGGLYGLSYDEQSQQNFTSYLGLRSGYDFMTRVGRMTPKVGLAWGHNFSTTSDYKMRYTDQGDEGLLYRLKPDSQDSDFADLDLGLDFDLGRAWQLGVSYKTALGSDERSDMFRIGLNGKF